MYANYVHSTAKMKNYVILGSDAAAHYGNQTHCRYHKLRTDIIILPHEIFFIV